jgi:hypothetical protein
MLRPRLLAVPFLLAWSVAACSDDSSGDPDAPIDATVDAVDAMGCGADYELTGEYVDWDSTTASFDGVEEAVWTVRGDTARTARTAPNGRIILCLARGATVNIDVVHMPAGAAEYVSALFVADPAVLSVSGGIFSARGLKAAVADDRYDTITGGMAFSTTDGHLLVVKRGTPTALTVTGATSYVSDGVDDVTWTAGDTGTFTLFPNVAVGTVTVGGTFTGPTTVPVEAGTLTIVPIS